MCSSDLVKDIQSFLGFANFYCRFIHEYSEIVIPLTCLTQKGIPWSFSNNCRVAFQCLKDTFTSAPILTHWLPDHPIIVETDASDYAISGIISICCEDGKIHPVAFCSRTLTSPELNYDTHDKELLVMVRLVRTPPTISDHLRLLRTHLRLIRMPPIISASIPLHSDVIPMRTV